MLPWDPGRPAYTLAKLYCCYEDTCFYSLMKMHSTRHRCNWAGKTLLSFRGASLRLRLSSSHGRTCRACAAASCCCCCCTADPSDTASINVPSLSGLHLALIAASPDSISFAVLLKAICDAPAQRRVEGLRYCLSLYWKPTSNLGFCLGSCGGVMRKRLQA